jgi:hypothetical protein
VRSNKEDGVNDDVEGGGSLEEPIDGASKSKSDSSKEGMKEETFCFFDSNGDEEDGDIGIGRTICEEESTRPGKQDVQNRQIAHVLTRVEDCERRVPWEGFVFDALERYDNGDCVL